MSAIQQLHAVVTGRVQGVFFRMTTQERARSLELAGWVRNRDDGSVEVLAEGPEPDLQLLLAFLHTGPRGARVDDVQARWGDAAGESRPFAVRG